MHNGPLMLGRILARNCGSVFAILLLASSCAAQAIRGAPARTPAERCNLFAAPNGQRGPGGRGRRRHLGTLAHPLRGPQQLLNALHPGQVGCLLNGTYQVSGELRVNHGGHAGKFITLMSAPGQTSQLVGGVVNVPYGSDYVRLTNLHIDTHGVHAVGVQIMGNHDELTYSDITNHNSQGSCIIIGYQAPARHVLIEGNVIHQCGHNPSDPYEDHGLYVDYAIDTSVVNNIFWGIPDGWAVQLYPDAVATQVLHNVMADNGQGVVFAGDSSSASSGNTVAYNVITSTAQGYDVESSWAGPVGSGNVAHDNCLFGAHGREVERPSRGFSSVENHIAKPLYVAPARQEYSLQADSPCLSTVGYDTAAQIRRR
jgi:hypothetical protein